MKIGGSLAEMPKELRALCVVIRGLAAKHSFVIVPGGGRFADAVREYDSKFRLPPSVAHKLAIMGMDQYGILLSQLIPDAQTFEKISGIQEVLDNGKVPVLLPYKQIKHDKILEESWDVTSDSIAAKVASQLHAKKLILVTDVDGIFEADPKEYRRAKLMPKISIGTLMQTRERTSVDIFLPRFLSKNPIDCYVVNGMYPSRIADLLSNREAVSTQIVPGDYPQ